MEFTRRFWTVVAVAVSAAGYGTLVGTPTTTVGAAVVGGWLLARQWWFRRALSTVDDALGVEQSVGRERLAVDESAAIGLTVERPGSTSLSLSVSVTANPPVGARGLDDDLTVTLDESTTTATASTTATWPVAGTHSFGPATVTATDRLGLFSETVRRGTGPAVSVEPQTTRGIHVGTGGDRFAGSFGEHPNGGVTRGVEPSELREYIPGDPANLIDWRATARQNTPYIKEFEGDASQRTVLVFDHRGSTAVGVPGERKLDYLREVALGFLDDTEAMNDPCGCYTVGDGGLTGEFDPRETDEHFLRVRRHLEALGPTGPTDEDVETDRQGPTRAGFDPATARRAASVLEEDGAFGGTLRPYFAASRTYVRRLAGDPLFEAIQTAIGRSRENTRTVVLTDDSDPGSLREALKLVSRTGNNAVVFLTPSVFFEPGGLADLEAAYDRYVEFEECRRELAALPRVTAFEVAPDDRLDTVLTAQRRPRPAGSGGEYGRT